MPQSRLALLRAYTIGCTNEQTTRSHSPCTSPTRTSPTCASAWRARAGPTSRRWSPGRPAPASPMRRSCATYWRDRLRLARLGGQAQRLPAVHGADRRHRPALHPRAGHAAGRAAAADLPRLAGIGVRVPQADPAADRALHGHCPVAAGLHAVVQARAEALQRRGHRRRLCGADDGRARLQALRRAGRRLGLLRRLRHGASLSRARERHPPQHAGRAARPGHARQPDA